MMFLTFHELLLMKIASKEDKAFTLLQTQIKASLESLLEDIGLK